MAPSAGITIKMWELIWAQRVMEALGGHAFVLGESGSEEGQQHGRCCRWIAEVRCEGEVRKRKQILSDTWVSWAKRRQVTGEGFGVKGEFKMIFSV